MKNIKVIEDTSSEYNYFLSDVLTEFIKEHFIELCEGQTFEIFMHGIPKELYMTRNMKLEIR